ncbi:EIF3D [Mytilus edulis]|uniref:EIF3D n=1 Tax=Mytilus edulis TaxID=6550 RepID=A0A8S3SHU2_MYTED|nr:EIF3D [Mytilus edulis]
MVEGYDPEMPWIDGDKRRVEFREEIEFYPPRRIQMTATGRGRLYDWSHLGVPTQETLNDPRFQLCSPPSSYLSGEDAELIRRLRYRCYKLGNDIELICRCEHDAVMTGTSGEVQFCNIKTLNEWDSRYCGGVDWRSKLDTQRGAVLATELKNNSCKLAKWTVCSMLAGSDQIKFGYVSRLSVRDTSKHIILGTQQFKPTEFANQINLNMDNAWEY